MNAGSSNNYIDKICIIITKWWFFKITILKIVSIVRELTEEIQWMKDTENIKFKNESYFKKNEFLSTMLSEEKIDELDLDIEELTAVQYT